MTHYIIEQPGVGYIVAQLETEDNWFLSNRYVRNFGWRQSDAIEFRKAAEKQMLSRVEPRLF